MDSIYTLDILRRKFLYIQFFFLAFAFLAFYLFQLKGSAVFLLILSLWNCFSYLYLFCLEATRSPYFHPFIIFPLVAIQYIGLNGISLYFDVIAGKPLYFGIYDVSSYIAQGALYLTLEHFLIFSGYYFYDRRKMKNLDEYKLDYMSLYNVELPYLKWSLRIYFLVWFIRLLAGFVPLASISSLFVLFQSQGQLVALTLLVFLKLHDNTNSLVNRSFWLITIIEVIYVLGFGMKEGILQNILPYIIYLIIGYKNGMFSLNVKFILKVLLLFVFIIYVVFPYISVFRSIADRKHISWDKVTVKETVSEYIDYTFSQGIYDDKNTTSDKSLKYALSRAGSIVCNSWSINYAQEKGLQTKYFYYCASAVIPRLLWPNKPPVVIGGMMYRLATGHSDWETSASKSRTAVTIGFIGGCYFSFGIFGALLFPFMAGFFISYFWHFLRTRLYYHPIAIWAFYTIIKTIFKDFENFTDGGFVFFIWSIAYIMIIKKIIPFNKYKFNEQ